MATTRDRWQTVKQLLWEALHEDEKNRAKFLDKACGDETSLRAEVESLLQLQQEVQDNGFLDSLASDPISPRFAGDALADLLDAMRSSRPPSQPPIALYSESDVEGRWSPSQLENCLEDLMSLPLGQAFKRLAGAASFRGSWATAQADTTQGTLGELLQHRQPPIQTLTILKRIARKSAKRSDSPTPTQVATLLYFASIAAAMARHSRRITKSSDDILRHGFQLMLTRPWIDNATRALFREAIQFIKR